MFPKFCLLSYSKQTSAFFTYNFNNFNIVLGKRQKIILEQLDTNPSHLKHYIFLTFDLTCNENPITFVLYSSFPKFCASYGGYLI